MNHEKPRASQSSLADVERQHILAVLQKNDWEVKKSAKELCIHRSTLYAKMKKYGIKRPEPGPA